MAIKATNNFIFIIRDKTESEKGGLLIPTQSVEKPHSGIIFSCGKMVRDPDLKKAIGKTAIFHKTTGQEIEFEGDTFVVLPDEHILGIK